MLNDLPSKLKIILICELAHNDNELVPILMGGSLRTSYAKFFEKCDLYFTSQFIAELSNIVVLRT